MCISLGPILREDLGGSFVLVPELRMINKETVNVEYMNINMLTIYKSYLNTSASILYM